jgi:hypothetical protein
VEKFLQVCEVGLVGFEEGREGVKVPLVRGYGRVLLRLCPLKCVIICEQNMRRTILPLWFLMRCWSPS